MEVSTVGAQTGGQLTPQDVYDAFNSKDIDRFAGLLADDYYFEGDHSEKVDSAGFLEFIKHYWGTFPDGKITGIRTVTQGNLAVGEGVFEGTHQGSYMGIPATGKKITFEFAEFFEFVGPKVRVMRVYSDTVTISRQLGSVPIAFLTGV